ncbi:protein phosphatase 2C domain-containing protein [Granulicoccus sp. GXG6511]|uniref:protein phosphatase 2C domain-containing protein n=1 Tax=Granulicoccus sp. GXG6511 TaxID=3381351 RepID=UPI003D7CC4D4
MKQSSSQTTLPETTVPETNAAPERNAVPETNAVPERNAVPEITAWFPVPPDLVAATREIDALSVRGVSFRGTAHEMFDEPRQDAFAVAVNQDWVVLAVADGIGSQAHSHHGAAAAVTAVAQAVETESLDPTDGPATMRVAVEAVQAQAGRLAAPATSLGTTLTVAAVERAGGETRHVVLHAVGDSPALVLDPAAARWTPVMSDDDGPGNVVHTWVPDRADAPRTMATTLTAGAVLVLASDGFTTPLGDGAGSLGADLAARWGQGPRELLPFVVDLSFTAYHDDKTVVALWNGALDGPAADAETAVDTEAGIETVADTDAGAETDTAAETEPEST